jgi:hypothetical protein
VTDAIDRATACNATAARSIRRARNRVRSIRNRRSQASDLDGGTRRHVQRRAEGLFVALPVVDRPGESIVRRHRARE